MLVFILLYFTKTSITTMLFALIIYLYLQHQNKSPRPIFGQSSLIPGLKKTPKQNLTFSHTSEYHQDVWKNVEFEFEAFCKPGIKLIFFHSFKFFSLLHNSSNLE